MIGTDLIEEIDENSERIGGITRLEPSAAAVYIQRIADTYVTDPSRLWWWDVLKVPTNRLSYGDTNGLLMLAKLVRNQRDTILVVTDDNEPPWPVYSGGAESIVKMLQDCRFFEYILAAKDMAWIVFDTHMNELVIAGRIEVDI